MRTDRRSFLTGAAAGALVPPLLRPVRTAAAVEAKPAVVRRGRAIAVSAKRTVVVAHAQRRTIAIGRKLVDVGGEPLELAIAPDGRLCAVTTAFWDEPGLALVDLRAGIVVKRLNVGSAPFGLAFSSDGARLYVTGGEQEGTVSVIDPERLRVVAQRPVGICPRSVAAVPGDDAAWVVLNGSDEIVRVAQRNGRVTRRLRTPALPDRVAVSPDGRRLLVTHGGRRAEHVSEIEIRTKELTRHRVGRLPSAVAWPRAGRRLVLVGGTGELVQIGGRRRRVGGAPRGLAVVGGHAWTADSLTDIVTRVRPPPGSRPPCPSWRAPPPVGGAARTC
jgi:YVTN family beta-propeller protein